MFLHFLGNGAGFADEHTSAYFVTNNEDFFLIDCPCSAFVKLKHLDLCTCNKLYTLITHTHGDQIGGLGLWVQYCFFVLQKKVTILAPSEEVKKDIITVLTIEGNEPDWYEISVISHHIDSLNPYDEFPYIEPVLTEHSPQLSGKCFGYYIEAIYGKAFVYTGDTSTLEPFKEFFDCCDELYVDTSVSYGQIHLKLEDALPDLIRLTNQNIKVYLMHLDNEKRAQKLINGIPNIKVASV